MSFCSYTFHFWVSCTSKLIFIVKPLYNISSVGTRLRSGRNKQKRDETRKNRQAKQAEWWTGEGGRQPSSFIFIPPQTLSLASLADFLRFPPTSEPGPRPLCITHKLTGDIHSLLLLFISCKLHQKQSGKGPRALLQKDLWKSLKELHNKIFTKVTVPWLSTSCSKLRWL